MIPDGPLHRAPWDLPDGRYVIERYAVSVAPSAGVLAALWRHPRVGSATPDHPERLLAFGDPAFAREAGAGSAFAHAETHAPLDSPEALPRLAGSGREARLVARYSPDAEVRLGDDASAGYLKHAPLERFGIIHFATVCILSFNPQAAARSSPGAFPSLNELPGGDFPGRNRDRDFELLGPIGENHWLQNFIPAADRGRREGEDAVGHGQVHCRVLRRCVAFV